MDSTKSILATRLKKQIIFALTRLVLDILSIVFAIGMVATTNTGTISESTFNGTTPIIFLILLVGAGIGSLIMWILGIVNATQINDITHDSILLIIFAIVPFIIVHLIIAIMEKNKFMEHQPEGSLSLSMQEKHLKTAFHNNVISAKEYEKKIKEIKENNNKK